MSLGPFDPFAMTAGMLTNLGYDILKQRAQSLDGTLAGKMLKWAGIIEPNFEERVRDTIDKASTLLLKEFPQYSHIIAVADFFKDPAVAHQIGDYILDGRSIDFAQLQAAFEKYLDSAVYSKLALRQQGLTSQQVIADFLTCYRRILREQLSVPTMGILLEMLDLNDATAQQLKANELDGQDHVQHLLQTKLAPVSLQNAYRTTQQQLANDLAAVVQGANATVQMQDVPQSIVDQPTPPTRPALFINGLCSGRIFQPALGQYFVGHGCDLSTFPDWRDCIVDAVAHVDNSSTPLKPYFAGDSILGGFRLCGICEKLYTADFSLFLLPCEGGLNVYLELGIAIGLGRPFFLIQKRDAIIPDILKGLGLYTQRGSLVTMRKELAGQVREYDFGAVCFIKDLLPAPTKDLYFIGAGEQFDDEDFEESVKASINAAYTQPLRTMTLASLATTGSGSVLLLRKLVETIHQTSCALYRVDTESSATTFLALGISIGLNRPFLMLKKAGSEVPLDVQGMTIYEFASFRGLRQGLVGDCRAFFERYFR
jgi:hypothetical protein